MLRFRDSPKAYMYECTLLCAICITYCLYKRSSVRARSDVPGLVFAWHTEVVGSTPIDIIIFNLII